VVGCRYSKEPSRSHGEGALMDQMSERRLMPRPRLRNVAAALLAGLFFACGGRVIEPGGGITGTAGDGVGGSESGNGGSSTLPPLSAFSGRLALLRDDGTVTVYPPHPTASTPPLAILTADAGQFACVSLTFDQTANLYVSCPTGTPSSPPHISVYSASPGESAPPSRPIAGPHTTLQADTPAIAVDPSGAIYVNEQNSTVLVFAPNAHGDAAPVQVLRWPVESQAFVPGALAFDHKGQLFAGNDRPGPVLVYPPNVMNGDKPVRRIGRNSELNAARALSLAPDGTTFVFDSGRRVLVYRAGAGEEAPIRTLTGADSFGAGPVGLAVEDTGRLFVLSAGRLNVFPPNAQGAAVPETWMSFSAIAVAIAP